MRVSCGLRASRAHAGQRVSCAHRIARYGPRIVSYGRRIVSYGRRIVSYGRRIVSYGRRSVGYGRRSVGCDDRCGRYLDVVVRRFLRRPR